MTKKLLFRNIFAVAVVCALFGSSCAGGRYRLYSLDDSSLTPLSHPVDPASGSTLTLPPISADWEILSADRADVTGDGTYEFVLAVRRPWRDWPIMRWRGGKSPIADFQDREGMSSHLIVMAADGTKLFAGSALPRPMSRVCAGDIDGDGAIELVTLEGDYARWPKGPALRIDIWRWDIFGFELVHRSGPGAFRELFLRDINNDDIVEIIVR
jgi:hypothetical protein